jgi:hypothetical protein
LREDVLLELISTVFKGHGFSVCRLAERAEQTADLLVEDGSIRYVVEVKQRDRSQEIEDALENAQEGELRYLQNEVIARDNSISSLIRKATSQLKATAHEDDFRIVWLQSSEEDADTDTELYVSSLLGHAYLITVQEDESEDFRCYFYELNDFYRDRDDLDAAFIGELGGFVVFLNPFSPRYEKLKLSRFAQVFQDGIHDPVEEACRGQALIVEGDVDRRNEQAVLAYLNERYGRRFANFKTHRIFAVSPISLPPQSF